MQVVGARPQFVKLAPVCRAIAAANASGARIENFIVHTGQHYDPAMSDVFFAELGIPAGGPRPRRRLRAATAGRPARMLEALEAAIVEHRPDLVLDLRRHQLDARRDARGGEAARAGGARRGGPAQLQPRACPRRSTALVADHLSDLLFAPTPEAMREPRARRPRGRARAGRRRDARRDPRLRAGRARHARRILERARRSRPATTSSRRCTAPRTRPPERLRPAARGTRRRRAHRRAR